VVASPARETRPGSCFLIFEEWAVYALLVPPANTQTDDLDRAGRIAALF
jgi:hypothetical protein